MVRGLEVFRDRFRDFSDAYILIGGTACSLAMEEVGREFRTTKDLDIVLCVEALNTEFFRAFWALIEDGRYTHRQKSTDKNTLYRFTEPKDNSFPYMIELFSRIPDISGFERAGPLTPIPAGKDASSLSAILIDTDYYEFLHRGIRHAEGVSYADPEILIPLKAKAWLDLSDRKDRGELVDSRDIKKNTSGIFRSCSGSFRPKRKWLSPKELRVILDCFLNGLLHFRRTLHIYQKGYKAFITFYDN